MKNDQPHLQTHAFELYHDGLEMFGRVVESSCKLSMQFVEAMNQASQTAEVEEPKIVAEAISSTMIPATGDLEGAAAAVAAAMNQSAQRKLKTHSAAEEPRVSMKETVARARSSISAIKPRGKS